jgi:hypothetical protein
MAKYPDCIANVRFLRVPPSQFPQSSSENCHEEYDPDTEPDFCDVRHFSSRFPGKEH